MREFVRLEDVSKFYVDDNYIVKNCSLSVYEGEILCLYIYTNTSKIWAYIK